MVKAEHKIQSAPSISTASSKKKYKGVRMRSWGSWVSEIRAPNQKTRIWLGSYSTPEAAARAYDAALLCLKGASANLNFPTTSTSHIPDTAMSPKSIQRLAATAAAAANSFTHSTNNVTATAASPPSTSSSASSPSSSISSPVMSYSPPDNLDDRISLMPSSEAEAMSALWFDIDGLQSPKFGDQMFTSSAALFDPPPMFEDIYEDDQGDIRLWSFC